MTTMSTPMKQLKVGVSIFVRKGEQSLWENGIFQNCLFLVMLLMRSPQDHVVDDLGSEIIKREVRDVRFASLQRSFHVATMDYDADLIVAESRRFITSVH